ncbi:hypothetical protein [Halobacillus seohaensis]|uniref:Integrase catalytic domain-containing protein n=1 Tax=Halobacillus seohaensis TaxID=447421 RepID=A0ABW2EMC5_9BACI
MKCFKREEFESYAHAYEALEWYIQYYTERRMHGSIQDLARVYARSGSESAVAITIKSKGL